MRVIGLTGGIATGKTTFSGALRARGVPVVDADALARAFGEGVLARDGSLDRKRMAALVFGDADRDDLVLGRPQHNPAGAAKLQKRLAVAGDTPRFPNDLVAPSDHAIFIDV